MELTDDDVRAILKLLDASVFADLELETEEFRLTLRRADAGGWTRETLTLKTAVPLESGAPGAPGAPGTPAGASGAAAAEGAAAAPGGAGLAAHIDIAAPLPGTFYRSPKPGSPPFVEVGDAVDAETVVAIIETMKLMTPIYAGARGRIAQICLRDAEIAAQDAVLMRIEPAAP